MSDRLRAAAALGTAMSRSKATRAAKRSTPVARDRASAQRESAPWLQHSSLLALLLVLGAAVWQHAGMLRYPFFADDYLFLDQLRGRGFLSAWTVHDPLRNYWRPLSRQVYFGFVGLLGESPLVAHILNLTLFLGILVLLYLLVRRLVSTRAAIVATALVALHEVADVPVLWASGSQDLLAVAGALGALYLSAIGRVRWAVVPFLAALLSKETVVVTPVIALWMLRQPKESWASSARRVVPLIVATVVWMPVWIVMMVGGYHQGLTFGPGSLPAAIAHLPQSFFGVQWGDGSPLSLLRMSPPPPLGPCYC